VVAVVLAVAVVRVQLAHQLQQQTVLGAALVEQVFLHLFQVVQHFTLAVAVVHLVMAVQEFLRQQEAMVVEVAEVVRVLTPIH
jgi:hypothetical protein